MGSKAEKNARQSHNVWTNKYLAIALGAIMVLFIVHHWLGFLYFKYGSKKPGRVTGKFVQLHRCVHYFLYMTLADNKR